MSDMGFPELNGNGPPDEELDRVPASAAMLRSIEVLAAGAAQAMQESAAEAKDLAGAVLDLAKAFILLDPSLTDTGTPLDHEVAMKQLELDAQVQTAREKAAQTKSITRSANGYEVRG